MARMSIGANSSPLYRTLGKLLLARYSIENRIRYLANRMRKPDSYAGSNDFTIVTATYNASQYLDEFFESIVGQSMKKSRIRLIIVDDGSTDESSAIIERWRARYPQLISYFRKENGGQASARNFGLAHVETEWVTFIDSDDIVSRRYFEFVDQAIGRHPDARMIVSRLMYYFDDENRFYDGHPLRYRFRDKETWFDCRDERCYPQLGMSDVFFRMSEIERQGLRVKEELRPVFEDSHFSTRYIIDLTEGEIGFMRKPVYYYRKRSDNSSTMDNNWAGETVIRKFTVIPENGHLDLLHRCMELHGRVPRNIQVTLLYDLQWYYKRLFGKPVPEEVDDPVIIVRFIDMLRELFGAIDAQVLMECPSTWFGFDRSVAILDHFKGEKPPYQIVSLSEFDKSTCSFILRVCDEGITLAHDGVLLLPESEESFKKTFLGEEQLRRNFRTYRLDSMGGRMTFSAPDGTPVKLDISGKVYDTPITVSEIARHYKINTNPAIKWFIRENNRG